MAKRTVAPTQLLLTQDPALVDLISRMVVYSPRKRLQPAEALAHPYFQCLK